MKLRDMLISLIARGVRPDEVERRRYLRPPRKLDGYPDSEYAEQAMDFLDEPEYGPDPGKAFQEFINQAARKVGAQ